MINDTLNYKITDYKLFMRRQDIKKYGNRSITDSLLSKDIKEFRHFSFEGFIAYKITSGIIHVICNPVTSTRDYLKATRIFVDRFPGATFYNVTHDYAKILEQLGLYYE